VVLRAVSWFEREPRAWAARAGVLRIQEGFGGCFDSCEVRLYPTGFRNHAERGESRGERGPGAVGLLVVGVARLLQ
jgi:hypothetical protein